MVQLFLSELLLINIVVLCDALGVVGYDCTCVFVCVFVLWVGLEEGWWMRFVGGTGMFLMNNFTYYELYCILYV